MTQTVYLPQFVSLFLGLTGINVENTDVDEGGWLFVPRESKLSSGGRYDRELIGALGWRTHLVNGVCAGWWFNPWPNIESKKFITLTLTEGGAKSFYHLEHKCAGRYVYFVDRIGLAGISRIPMLLGHFLFEIESCPDTALLMRPGGTNRISYPRDARVSEFGPLTSDEVHSTKNRLSIVAEECSTHARDTDSRFVDVLRQLIQTL